MATLALTALLALASTLPAATAAPTTLTTPPTHQCRCILVSNADLDSSLPYYASFVDAEDSCARIGPQLNDWRRTHPYTDGDSFAPGAQADAATRTAVLEELLPVPTSVLMSAPLNGEDFGRSRIVCRSATLLDDAEVRRREKEGDLHLVLIQLTVLLIGVILAVEIVGLVRVAVRRVSARRSGVIRLVGQEQVLWTVEKEEDGANVARIPAELAAVEACYDERS